MRLILAIPFLLLTISSSIIFKIQATNPNPCPTSTCGDLSISYPFKLPTAAAAAACSYVDLRCNGTSAATITLPRGGDFAVRAISYAYPYVQLYDPGGCLAGRLIAAGGPAILASTPFAAAGDDAFSFYTCPAAAALGAGAHRIDCLSNGENVTVAAAAAAAVEGGGCVEVGGWEMPVLFGGFDGEDLYLTWDSTSCKACGGDEGDSWHGWSKSPLFSSAFVVLAMAFTACSCLFTRKIAGRPGAAAAGLPVSGIAMAALPPLPLHRGMDESKIDSCTKAMVLGEGIVDHGSDAHTCPICLERFEPHEVVRSIVGCDHCFHGGCIVTWLIKSRTCPVCRIILSNT